MFDEVKKILCARVNEFLESSIVMPPPFAAETPADSKKSTHKSVKSRHAEPLQSKGEVSNNDKIQNLDSKESRHDLAFSETSNIKSNINKIQNLDSIKNTESAMPPPCPPSHIMVKGEGEAIALTPKDIPLEYPKNKDHGHFATTICFVLAKKLRKNPKQLAENLSEFLQKKAMESITKDSKKDTIFESVTALNGYLNLTLSLNFLESKINTETPKLEKFIESKEAFTITESSEFKPCEARQKVREKENEILESNDHKDLDSIQTESLESKETQNLDSTNQDTQNKNKILLEYVSANPTGPLHIGHARGAIFGSALQSLGQYLGEEIISEYYVNDAGSQINMLSASVFNAAIEILNTQNLDSKKNTNLQNLNPKNKKITPLNTQVYKGEYIIDVAKDALNHFGRDFFYQDFSKIETQLGDYAKNQMLNEIKRNLKNARISFDTYVSEKALYQRLEQTLKDLESHNALYNENGAIWLKSTLKGDDKDRVLVRESGEPTYMAGDIIYHRDKFARGYRHYINIWGADHHGYINRIKASVDFLGYDSSHLEVLLAQMVSLLKGGQPYKMSKRAGNFILMQDVIDEIGVDSLRFIFLSKSLDTHLEFDIDDLQRQDSSNPIFYINYANARIHTLLEKSNFNLDSIKRAKIADIFSDSHHSLDFNKASKNTRHAELLQSKGEASNIESKTDSIESKSDLNTIKNDIANLLFTALSLEDTLHSAYSDRGLHKICDYLKSLAKATHAFYNAHKILNTPLEKEILKTLYFISLTLTATFQILGIQIKTKM